MQREELRVSYTAFNVSTTEWKLFYYHARLSSAYHDTAEGLQSPPEGQVPAP